MFSDKGFATGANAGPYSGSAAAAIVGIVTAVTVADTKHVGNSFVPPTSVTEKLWKQNWIKETASEPIAYAWQNVPLWIKVHPGDFPQARLSLRCVRHRLPLCNTANQRRKPE
jgi:hypothetical protein